MYFYVLGSYDENELILLSALNGLYECLGKLLRGQLDRRTLLENLDFVLLTLDELSDDGILLEADPAILAQRVSMRNTDDIPIADQTLSEAMRTLKTKANELAMA